MSDPRDDLTALERSLSGLAPSRAVDRDRLMYEAGRRAGLREASRGWRWPAVAAAFALATLVQGVVLSRRPAERVVERIVAVPDPMPAPDPVVILTRREPERPRRPGDPFPDRPASLSARSRFDATAEAGPPLLSVVYLGPMDPPSAEPLNPRNGRDGDLQSLVGGPL